MKRSYLIVIPGNPVAKKRHRDSKYGGKYNPSAADEKRILKCAKEQVDGVPMILGAVDLRIDFFFRRPKKHYRTGKFSHILKDNPPKYHIVKPDEDNVNKLVKDALNKFMWKDDSQVAHADVWKYYDDGNGARMVIKVYEL